MTEDKLNQMDHEITVLNNALETSRRAHNAAEGQILVLEAALIRERAKLKALYDLFEELDGNHTYLSNHGRPSSRGAIENLGKARAYEDAAKKILIALESHSAGKKKR